MAISALMLLHPKVSLDKLHNLLPLDIIFSKVDRRPSLLAILSFTGALMLLSLAVPADVQGVLLVVNQALFSGLYYLIDVYVIEVWPTEVHISYRSFVRRYKVKRGDFCAGSQLWFQHDGKCEQGRIRDRPSNCRPWRAG